MNRDLRSFLSLLPRALPGASLLVAALLLMPPTIQGQPSGWAWTAGSNTFTANGNGHAGSPGVYGMLGKAAAGNVPGGRLGAVSWTDATGNFWLFGGAGLDSVPQFGFLNDLWKYVPATNQWTWMSGSSSIPAPGSGAPGIYGTLGTPDPHNVPGGRSGALAWTDATGKLWLFGGAGFDSTGRFVNLNDLWKYDPTTSQWTWMGGTSTVGVAGGVSGNYGTLGSLTSGGYPGSRNNAVVWVDSGGSFWMFGGYGEDALAQHGELNDLWKFLPDSNQWAWMGGKSQLQSGGVGWPGVYGTLGKPDPANIPGGRDSAVGWVDKTGNLWLFGGNGYAVSGSTVTNGNLNDLWEFNPSTNEWIWTSGSNSLPATCTTGGSCALPGVYGTAGDFTSTNTPGGRSSLTAWTGADGSLWLFGGNGDDSTGAIGFLNDLWIFDPGRMEWAWISGSSTVGNNGQPGSYGTKGTPGTGNSPGGRDSAVGWIDLKGNLWLMGGNGLDANATVGYLNDLWEFPLTASAPLISPASGTYTSVQVVSLADTTPGASIYYTTDGSTPTAASDLYSGPITVSSSQTIKAVAIATGYSASVVASSTYTVNLPAASAPVFNVPGGTYTSSQTVTITDSTPNAMIYYTTDGSAPTASSTVYSHAITVSASQTIEAIAVAVGYSASAASSAAYTINLPPPTFTFSASAGTLALNAGGQGTVTLTVNPQNGFNSVVSFACSGLPAGASCSFSPQTVTPSGAAATTTLTIGGQTLTSILPANFDWGLGRTVLVLVFGILGLRNRRGRLLVMLAVSAVGLGVLSACGGSGSHHPVSSTVTVSATSGSIRQSVAISLTVN